jgi:twitching motility protein PilT
MQTFDQHILELYENGLVSEETAKVYASRKSAIGRGLDRIKAARGESTSGISGLAMKKKEIR